MRPINIAQALFAIVCTIGLLLVFGLFIITPMLILWLLS